MPPRFVAPRRKRGALLKAVLIIVLISVAALALQYSQQLCRAVVPASSAATHAADDEADGTATSAGEDRSDSPDANRIPLYKPCAAGCAQRGNCNFEEGRCECGS